MQCLQSEETPVGIGMITYCFSAGTWVALGIWRACLFRPAYSHAIITKAEFKAQGSRYSCECLHLVPTKGARFQSPAAK